MQPCMQQHQLVGIGAAIDKMGLIDCLGDGGGDRGWIFGVGGRGSEKGTGDWWRYKGEGEIRRKKWGQRGQLVAYQQARGGG